MNGFLIVDKPSGMTSQTVCNKIKHAYGLNKVGHNGTLDPETTGVMVVALDRATKMLQYLTNEDKTYLTTIVFGLNSNTLDVFGNITEDIPMDIKEDKLNEALAILKEKKTQIPPMVSAIKLNGKKLMDYERKGIEVNLKEREASIIELERIGSLRFIDNHYEVDLRLHVTKGFYVRSFARDLGKLMGGVAIMKKLRRLAAGSFNEGDSILLSEILKDLPRPLQIDEVFKYPKIEANARILNFIKNGVTIYPHNLINDCRHQEIDSLNRFYFTYNNENIALYEKKDDVYRPIFIF